MKYHALVVDDEALVRNLTIRALTRQEFHCDSAANGEEASQLIACTKYDIVITDLRMPNKHGHALAQELLSLEDRPLIVVLTGVVEPRLAKDLRDRGVDDIVFKPVDFGTFAAKIKSLVAGKHRAPEQNSDAAAVDPAQRNDEQQTAAKNLAPSTAVSLDEYQRQLQRLPETMPISQGTVSVYQMANSGEFDAAQISSAIRRQDSLTKEILQLANSKFYNPSGVRIIGLERCVIQIGHKRIGQLALAANALAAVSNFNSLSIDTSPILRGSVAAGFAIELLIAQGRHQAIEDGLLLCATMASLGRIALASMFPDQYRAMRKRCEDGSSSILEHEQSTFPCQHTEIISAVLQSWGIAPHSYEPLRHVLKDYRSIGALPDPLRTRVTLVKLATLIGQIAIQHWDAWDRIEVPSPQTVEQLGIDDAADIVRETEANVQGINDFRVPSPPTTALSASGREHSTRRSLAYLNLVAGSSDLLAHALNSLGYRLHPPGEKFREHQKLMVNCLGADPKAIENELNEIKQRPLIILTDAEHRESHSKFGRAVALPISCTALRQAIRSSVPTAAQ